MMTGRIHPYYGPLATTEIDPVFKAPDPWGLFKAYLLVADAVTLAVPGATSAPILFNPSTSNVVLQIDTVALGVTGGTIIAGAIEYALYDQWTYTTVTAGPVPINSSFGKGNACRGLWYKACTGGAVPTVILPYGDNSGGANGAGARSFEVFENLNIYLWPGQAFFPCVASGAVAATVIPRVEFAQIPIGYCQ